MSFSFRRSNAKQVKTETSEDDANDRWQFGFNGINFEEDEVEFELAPNWPEQQHAAAEKKTQTVEQLAFPTDAIRIIRLEEESPRPVAIELVDVLELQQQDEEDRLLLEKRAAAQQVRPLVEDLVLEEEVVVVKSPIISSAVSVMEERVEKVAVIPQQVAQPIVAITEDYKTSGKLLPSDPALSFEQNLRRRFGGHVRSALGPGTVIEGKFRFDEPVRIDGELSGEVRSTSALIVGEEATVEGRINVGALIVMGEVTGPIIAEDLVELKSGARVRGDITTKRIAIEDGAVFEGEIVTRS